MKKVKKASRKYIYHKLEYDIPFLLILPLTLDSVLGKVK
jgi:hypothetical protein